MAKVDVKRQDWTDGDHDELARKLALSVAASERVHVTLERRRAFKSVDIYIRLDGVDFSQLDGKA